MNDQPSILERAFQIARSGSCNDMSELRGKLKEERYEGFDAHLQGSSLSKQLQGIMKAAQQTPRDA